MNNVLKSRILVVGSGGLGCELLKSLVLNGFENISIVDFDKVVLSNLNRQFLFQKNDVGKFKSQIAFENIKPWNTSKFPQFYVGRVEELSLKLLSEFDVIFSALDTIQSRRWLNSAFFEIYRFYNISNTNSQLSEDNSLKILIDGGSQDLYGHVRVIRPGFTSCLECSLTLYSSEIILCIFILIMVHQVFLPPAHLMKIRRRAILNIPTTNSIISSLMVNVLLTQDFNYNFYFYSGDGITNLSKFKLQPDQNCVVCNCKCIKLKVKLEMKLVDLLRVLYKKISVDSINISSDLGVIYFDNPKSLSDLYAYRLNMKLSDLKDVLSGKLYLTSKDSQTWIIYLIFQ
uniref:THIF-type NAD/FAD binding fold domain-containing protein n=1 Tax=Theileria parva TaxID=5875 RepID=Q4N869_THEPA|eukprot:XP_766122.1 hypothetical protein [Theileria parva strain Muguga]